MGEWKDPKEVEQSLNEVWALTQSTELSLRLNEGTSIETIINLNMPEAQCSLANQEISIEYSRSQLMANPFSYLSSLSAAQEKYLKSIRAEVHEGYGELNSFVGLNSQLRTLLELIREGDEKRVIGIAKAVVGVQNLFKGQNLKSMMQELTSTTYDHMQVYMVIERFFGYGQGFLEKFLKEDGGKLNVGDKKKLEECVQGAKDIDYVCKRIVDTAKKEIAEIKEIMDTLYTPKVSASG